MPYCTLALSLSVEQAQDAQNIISRIAIEQFNAKEAYPLDAGMFSIDRGENNVRAILSDENKLIKFFSRYKKDSLFYDKKIQAFAINHGIETIHINNQQPVLTPKSVFDDMDSFDSGEHIGISILNDIEDRATEYSNEDIDYLKNLSKK